MDRPDSGLISVNLFIAHLGIQIISQSKELADGLCERYRGFTQGTDTQFEAIVHVNHEDNNYRIEDLPISFDGGRVVIDLLGFHGWIDIEQGKGEISLPNRRTIENIDYFLRLVAALMIFDAGGIMLHAAGIASSDRVNLFLGHSGSGKTTIARFSPNESVLNDDLVALYPEGDEWVVYATPFWNTSQVRPLNKSGRLDSIYCLTQDYRVYLENLSPAKALAELISSVPVITSDSERCSALLTRCQAISRAIKIYLLHFLPDNTFWNEISPKKVLS